MIEIKNLFKRFPDGDRWNDLFVDLSLDIGEGEFVALTGPSGCGKTTLLNMIGGLDRPDSGAVVVDRVDMSKLSASARARFLNKNVGFIFQLHYLLPEQTALGNVMLPLRIGGAAGKMASARAKELLEKLRLGGRLGAYPTTMSGGECQRVAIARALATRPKVLLTDEPTASLNKELKHEVFDDLLKLSRSEGTTVVLVTHDVELIARVKGQLRNIDLPAIARPNEKAKPRVPEAVSP